MRLGTDVFVVDDAVGINAVRDAVEVLAGHIHRAAVGQVTAVGEVHAHEGVAGVQNGKEDSHIGLCAGVGLDVGVVAAEELLGALNGNVFHHVDALAAAVVTLAGIALSVFVGQDAAHGHHDFLGDDVLGGDQLQVSALSGELSLHGLADFRIVVGNSFQGFFQHGISSISNYSFRKKAQRRYIEM